MVQKCCRVNIFTWKSFYGDFIFTVNIRWFLVVWFSHTGNSLLTHVLMIPSPTSFTAREGGRDHPAGQIVGGSCPPGWGHWAPLCISSPSSLVLVSGRALSGPGCHRCATQQGHEDGAALTQSPNPPPLGGPRASSIPSASCLRAWNPKESLLPVLQQLFLPLLGAVSPLSSRFMALPSY